MKHLYCFFEFFKLKFIFSIEKKYSENMKIVEVISVSYVLSIQFNMHIGKQIPKNKCLKALEKKKKIPLILYLL